MRSKQTRAQAMIEYLIIATALTFSAVYFMDDLDFSNIVQRRNVKILDRLHQPIP